MTYRTHRRRPRILLGISGSVAAVKGPELALRLYNELDADVIIVLTRTGEHFWYQSEKYNESIYRELQALINNEEGDWSSQVSDLGEDLQKSEFGTAPKNDESVRKILRIHRKTCCCCCC